MSPAPDPVAQDIATLARASDLPLREDVLQELVRQLQNGRSADNIYESLHYLLGFTRPAS